MRNIRIASILALLILFSAGCQKASQSGANPNNSNAPDASTNPPTSPAAQQTDMNQPGAAPQNGMPNPDMAAAASSGPNISMMAMEFHSSLVQGDKTRLEPLLADDYKRTRSDGTVVNKAQELASLKKSDDMFSMEAQPAQVNGDTATVTAKVTLNSKDAPGNKIGTWQTTDTFKKRKDKWVVVTSVEKKG